VHVFLEVASSSSSTSTSATCFFASLYLPCSEPRFFFCMQHAQPPFGNDAEHTRGCRVAGVFSLPCCLGWGTTGKGPYVGDMNGMGFLFGPHCTIGTATTTTTTTTTTTSPFSPPRHATPRPRPHPQRDTAHRQRTRHNVLGHVNPVAQWAVSCLAAHHVRLVICHQCTVTKPPVSPLDAQLRMSLLCSGLVSPGLACIRRCHGAAGTVVDPLTVHV
jgi:hypothetical protein